MKHLIEDVIDFHDATDTPICSKPKFPSTERRELRRDLIREEYNEYLDAEDVDDLVEVADALVDLVYVVVGCAIEYGIPLDKVWDEVQRSNMAKIDPATGKVRKREDGKVLKPDGWTPPDIKGALGQ
jgi:predicted HAD superfamily Cof-like phosphohydrolase